MNNYPHPVIAREGWCFLGIALALALLVTFFSGAWSIPFWIIALFVLQFFRDPGRVIPQHPNAVLSPVDGKINNVQYFPGKFVNAGLDKASSENERNALTITAANGQAVTCVQVAGLIARRILCYVKRGDALARGQRYGFICFGSRVDVYLSLTVMPKVTVGDKVSATETIQAEF